MGTRSLTHIYDAPVTPKTKPKPLLTFYRQYDGYPSGHGALISKVFKGRTLTNGYGDALKQVNGMNNAAAMLIGSYYTGAHDETQPMACGNLYIQKPGAKDYGEEYTYHLHPNAKGDGFHLRVIDYKNRPIFEGPLDEFDPLIQEEDE